MVIIILLIKKVILKVINVLAIEHITKLIDKHTFNQYLLDLVSELRKDFARWNDFTKIPRPAFHVPNGVIELMPIADHEYFAYKYVNGHPNNPLQNKQTVIATGQLSQVNNGYPLLITEMTLLTALRTAAVSILASDLLARQDAKTLAIIGTGAQSEFQTLAHTLVRPIQRIQYHDIDDKAMSRFNHNLKKYPFELIPCSSNEEAVANADIIIVCTACKKHVDIIKNNWIGKGVHINALGGDCPGKTELELSLLARAKVVVEFFEQSYIEGEIQRLSKEQAQQLVYAELWEIITKQKQARSNPEEITIFDSVGFALEDFSTLTLTHRLTQHYQIGKIMNMVPPIEDPKDLFSCLQHSKQIVQAY